MQERRLHAPPGQGRSEGPEGQRTGWALRAAGPLGPGGTGKPGRRGQGGVAGASQNAEQATERPGVTEETPSATERRVERNK